MTPLHLTRGGRRSRSEAPIPLLLARALLRKLIKDTTFYPRKGGGPDLQSGTALTPAPSISIRTRPENEKHTAINPKAISTKRRVVFSMQIFACHEITIKAVRSDREFLSFLCAISLRRAASRRLGPRPPRPPGPRPKADYSPSPSSLSASSSASSYGLTLNLTARPSDARHFLLGLPVFIVI